MFVNDLYVTIIRRGFHRQGRAGGSATKLFGKRLGVDAGEIEREAKQRASGHDGEFRKEMASYNTKVLGCEARDGVVCSEICEFLAQLVNGGCPVNMALPRMALDEYLPTKPHHIRQEGAGSARRDRRGYAVRRDALDPRVPGLFGAGMLDGLLRIPHEFIIAQSFALEDRAPVLSERRAGAAPDRRVGRGWDRGRRRRSTSRETSWSTGATVLGYHHLSVLRLGRTLREMEKCVQAATQELQGFGTIVVREDMNAEPAFWAQLPGNCRLHRAQGADLVAQFRRLRLLHNFAVGQKESNRWGPAISVLETTSQTPY